MNTNLLKTFLFVAAMALATLACGLLSSIPSIASSVPSIASSVASLPTAAGNSPSNVLLQDDFSDSNSGWGTGTDTHKSVEYLNGSLDFKVFKTFDLVYSTPSDKDFQGVHIEVTVTPNKSDPSTGYGILCDQQVTGDAFYYFVIRNTGEYAIVRSAVAKDDVFLTSKNSWGTSKLIPTNASTYAIGADCGNGRLALYVNGAQIDSALDSVYTTGKVGLFAWSDKKANAVDVNFDNFVMTALK